MANDILEKKRRGRPPKDRSLVIESSASSAKIEVEPKEVITKVMIVDKALLRRKRTDANPEPTSVFAQAAQLVGAEMQAYENSMRLHKETIKRCYKNYVGIFDQPSDPYTKRRKIFTALTHNIVDSIAKPVKVSARSIKILPVTDESRGKAKILNMVLPYFFQQMDFDTMMSNLIHRVTWFGHQITVQDWLYEEKEIPKDDEATTKQLLGFADKEKAETGTMKVISDRPRIRLVNVMDVFCPATAESLPWAVKRASVILRSVLPLTDIQANPFYDPAIKAELQGWTYEGPNLDDSSALDQYGTGGFSSKGEARTQWGGGMEKTKNPFVTLFERYGMIPKSWVTGDTKDSMVQVPGIITSASSSGTGREMKTLSVRLSPFGDYGPFEEAAFNKIPNRWMGEGIGERLIPLQAWHNEIVNNRRNNELLVQHRMFKYRKGSVDPAQLFSRPAGGIAVENMGDLEWLPTPDVSQSSFAEDSAIEASAMRLAGAAMAPIQKKITATEASGIQAQSQMTFNELRDTIEKYLERLILNHMIPLLQRYFREKKTLPIELPLSELQMLDTYNGYAPFMTEQMGNERFLMVDDSDVFDGEFMVTVDIDSVSTNRQAQVAALTNALALGAKIQDSGLNIKAMLRKIVELSGITDSRLFEDAKPAMPTGVTNAPPMPQEAAQMGLPPEGMPPQMMGAPALHHAG